MNSFIPTNSNPIYWREKQRLANSRSIRRVFRAVYIIYGIIFALIGLLTLVQSRSVLRGFYWVDFIDILFFATVVTVAIGQWLTLIFFVPPLIAGTISEERKNETFELLFLTPLTSRQIIFGKARASLPFALKIVFFIALAVLVLIPFVGFTGSLNLAELGEMLIIMATAQALVLIMTVFVVMLTLYISTFFKQTAVVVATAYGAIFAHFITSIMLLAFSGGGDLSLIIHPILALGIILDSYHGAEIFTTTILCVTLYAGISYGLVSLTINRVQEIAGRPKITHNKKKPKKQHLEID